MLLGGHGDNDSERRFEFPHLFRRDREEAPEAAGLPDEEIQKLIEQLGASVGTDAVELLRKPGAAKAETFLEMMHDRGLPGALRLPIGDNTYARGYMIGAIECNATGGIDRNGPYLTGFGARVYLCEDGKLRSKIGDMFVPAAFGEAELVFEPEYYSDVVMQDDFRPGHILANPADHQQRFYPMSLESQLGYLADLNP